MRWTVSVLSLLCLVCGAVRAERMQVLAVEEPPASYTDEHGVVTGFAVDFLREIQRRVGNDDPVTTAPEARVYDSGLRGPNVVLLSFTRTPEREESFYWIARIIRKPWVFYARADNTGSLRSLDDVRRLGAVGVITGDVRARWLAARGLHNLLLADSHEQSMRLLLARRVDVLFTEPQAVAYFCRVRGCPGGTPRALWSPRGSDVYILMSRRGTASATARQWTAAAAAAKADGTFAALARRWASEAGRRFGVRAAYQDGVLNFCTDSQRC